MNFHLLLGSLPLYAIIVLLAAWVIARQLIRSHLEQKNFLKIDGHVQAELRISTWLTNLPKVLKAFHLYAWTEVQQARILRRIAELVFQPYNSSLCFHDKATQQQIFALSKGLAKDHDQYVISLRPFQKAMLIEIAQYMNTSQYRVAVEQINGNKGGNIESLKKYYDFLSVIIELLREKEFCPPELTELRKQAAASYNQAILLEYVSLWQAYPGRKKIGSIIEMRDQFLPGKLLEEVSKYINEEVIIDELPFVPSNFLIGTRSDLERKTG